MWELEVRAGQLTDRAVSVDRGIRRRVERAPKRRRIAIVGSRTVAALLLAGLANAACYRYASTPLGDIGPKEMFGCA
jgi:hypothetical protein